MIREGTRSMPERSTAESRAKAMFWEGRLMDVLVGDQEMDIAVIQKNVRGMVEAMSKEGERITAQGAERLVDRAQSVFGDPKDLDDFEAMLAEVTEMPEAA